MDLLTVEVIGHVSLALVFAAVFAHVLLKQNRMRRNLRASKGLFWLTVIGSGSFGLFNLIQVAVLLIHNSTARIPPMVDLLSEYPMVIIQSVIIGYLLMNKIVTERASRPMRILAIGAHPDDIEIAAGATLAKLHDAGHKIYGLVLTCGEMGGNADRRPLEAHAGAKFLELDHLDIKDFIDTRLREEEALLVQAIEAPIREIKPDLIFTHSAHDIHQDHQAVHDATLRAARNQTSILCYESPSATMEFNPSVFVDVADYTGVKVAAIQSHWDQRNKPYMKEEQIRGKLAFRGGQARMEYAEGFEVVRMSLDARGVL